jgi:hypothetical protein
VISDKQVSELIRGFEKIKPGFRNYLRGAGIYTDDECNIVGLDESRAYLRRGKSHGGGGGGGGGGWGGWLVGLIVVLFIGYMALNIISAFQPSIGNLTYGGGGVGETIFGLVQTWFLPLALLGLVIYVLYAFLGHKGR